MQYLHWIVVVVHMGVTFILIKGWDSYLPSHRRILIAICSVIAMGYFIPVSYVANETTKRTDFCLRCHVMEPYGAQMKIASNELLASTHYLNNYIPQKTACYDCHADYEMFNDVRSKVRGMMHLYKYYISTPANPIRVYNPYPNRNCLTCHESSMKYRQTSYHHFKSKPLVDINSGKVSCMTKGCHDVPHFYPNVDGG